MKNFFVNLIVSMIISSAFAYGVYVVLSNEMVEAEYVEASYQTSQEDGTLHFVNHRVKKGETLPDLTYAAQRGVEAVVNVETLARTRTMNIYEYFFGGGRSSDDEQQGELRRSGGGSGVVISDDGYIVTNNHVIDKAQEVRVTLNSGESYTARLVGTDPATDIALLKIDAAEELKFITFGDSESLKLGEWVLAIGNPYGLNSTVTAGIVSAKGRSLGASRGAQMGLESFIQTDAAVNPGNSGGALITATGQLVGINTLIKSPTGSFAGYSFAVPTQIVEGVVGDLLEFGEVRRALLGISMQTTADNEVIVAQVVQNGAADSAGMKQGDIIVAINDHLVRSVGEIQKKILEYKPQQEIEILVKRGGELKHFEVTLRNRVD